ncbi:MAG: hypothetical protein IJ651_04120 [Bacteroidales bacterium]|nr:hypothetical protein [Bacteroidales bacterium]
MKKYILPLLACLLAASACELKDEYYVKNIQDIVTAVSKTELQNDYGTVYTVTVDNTDGAWKKDVRYLISFDITNRQYDIDLNAYKECNLVTPSPLAGELPLGDPVAIESQTISGGYFNVFFSYYKKKDSSYPHRFSMHFVDDSEKGILELYLTHDGNGENPAFLDKEELELTSDLYCFHLAGLLPEGTYRTLWLYIDEVDQEEGVKVIKRNGYRLYDQSIIF